MAFFYSPGDFLLGKIVDAVTCDGVKLHGFLAEVGRKKHAWILVHGVNGSFCSSTLLRSLADTLVSERSTVLLADTRGHDILSFNTGPTPMFLGSQVETISACRFDLQAWADLLVANGIESCSVLGHSLGAIKSLLWAASNDSFIQSIVAVSPPRLNTELLLSDEKKGAVFKEHLEEALQHCADGRPDKVMKVRFPLPMRISAATYRDKYGSGDTYDYLALASQIGVRLLWTFGQIEVEGGTVNFRDADISLADTIRRLKGGQQLHQIAVIPNGDHSYREARAEICDCVFDWAAGVGKL